MQLAENIWEIYFDSEESDPDLTHIAISLDRNYITDWYPSALSLIEEASSCDIHNTEGTIPYPEYTLKGYIIKNMFYTTTEVEKEFPELLI